MKRIFVVELNYDKDVMHGDDPEGIKYFEEEILEGKLILFSSEIGDDVGKIKIIKEMKKSEINS